MCHAANFHRHSNIILLYRQPYYCAMREEQCSEGDLEALKVYQDNSMIFGGGSGTRWYEEVMAAPCVDPSNITESWTQAADFANCGRAYEEYMAQEDCTTTEW